MVLRNVFIFLRALFLYALLHISICHMARTNISTVRAFTVHFFYWLLAIGVTTADHLSLCTFDLNHFFIMCKMAAWGEKRLDERMRRYYTRLSSKCIVPHQHVCMLYSTLYVIIHNTDYFSQCYCFFGMCVCEAYIYSYTTTFGHIQQIKVFLQPQDLHSLTLSYSCSLTHTSLSIPK